MFSRNHPFLFFLLVAGAMATLCIIALTIMVVVVSDGTHDIDGERIGVIEINGPIVDSQHSINDIKLFRDNKAVRALVIRINSPGGGVGPSQEIYREIRRTMEHKKVIASMGAVAASGGYYVASAADGIVANPGTITGSIGVIMGYTNFEELMDKIGLKAVVIKSGEYKDVGSPTRPMTDREKNLLEAVTQDIHQQFVGDVAQGRQMEIAAVDAIADGRIITGEKAQALGLVDRLGNFQDAVQWAGELAGIEGDPEILYPKKEKIPFLQYFIESALQLWTDMRSRGDLVPQARL